MFSSARFSDVGKQAQQYLDSGRLVPDSLVNQLVVEEIQKSSNSHWLLDGKLMTIIRARAL